jgi:predicted transcriptional regulator
MGSAAQSTRDVFCLVGDLFGALVARQKNGARRGQPSLAFCAAKRSMWRTEVAAMAVETNLTELTVMIVACFVSNNPLAAVEMPALISATHAALCDIDAARAGPASVEGPMAPVPAVPVNESVMRDYLICLNDGRKLRALKRYLWRKYALSPEQYRKKWGLPDDYPMVAPAYSALRAKIAKQSNGRSRSPEREN